MIKNRRHKMIREIVENKNIETQFQLTDELKKYGFNVTQATISRDIKELGLIKVASGEDFFRYSFPPGSMTGNIFERAKKMLRDNMLRINKSNNLIIMRTLPGTAQGVAFCIDSLTWKEVLGTIAGDDTIMVIVKESEDIQEVIDRLQSLAQ
ncbi:MAG: arginine repressor [Bacillota bacterium]|jgi:transcriptional regulator of arginine metabolism